MTALGAEASTSWPSMRVTARSARLPPRKRRKCGAAARAGASGRPVGTGIGDAGAVAEMSVGEPPELGVAGPAFLGAEVHPAREASTRSAAAMARAPRRFREPSEVGSKMHPTGAERYQVAGRRRSGGLLTKMNGHEPPGPLRRRCLRGRPRHRGPDRLLALRSDRLLPHACVAACWLLPVEPGPAQPGGLGRGVG